MRLILRTLALFVSCATPWSLQGEGPSPRTNGASGKAQIAPVVRPKTFGTSQVSYISAAASDFSPMDSGQSDYTTDFAAGTRWGTNAVTATNFLAPLRLPSGARPVYLELDFVDTNPAVSVFASLRECEPASQACTLHPLADAGCGAAGFICSGASNASGVGTISADLTPDAFTVDNASKNYSFYAATPAGAGDGSVKISAVVVGYVLQVSPAPGTASFADVPPTDPFFQYIEALKASGITGGCGDGSNFCPNDPVLRKQMATFLAKALGLQWP